ncbi:MAG: DUF4397 domain-containing protein [Sphingobacteriales bacterium]|nr:MAG: DUF4397 domain-containing protein [Sphingobacteriales bacterium]
MHKIIFLISVSLHQKLKLKPGRNPLRLYSSYSFKTLNIAMKFTFISKLMLCMGAAVTLSSCSIDDDDYPVVPPVDAAFGVIANASPNSGELFFFADSNRLNNAGITYTGAEGYYNLYTGSRIISVKNAGGTTLATDTITLAAGQYFSTFAVNTFDNIELVTYGDSLQYPANGKAYVRFTNLSPDADSINVASPSTTFATGLAFMQATDFIEVPSGIYDFNFTDAATTDTLFTDSAVNLYAGHIYTIYTKGFVTPATGSNETFSTKLLRNY